MFKRDFKCPPWHLRRYTIGTCLSWKIFVNLRIRRGKLRTNILIKHLRLRKKCVRSSYDKNVRTKFNKTTPCLPTHNTTSSNPDVIHIRIYVHHVWRRDVTVDNGNIIYNAPFTKRRVFSLSITYAHYKLELNSWCKVKQKNHLV